MRTKAASELLIIALLLVMITGCASASFLRMVYDVPEDNTAGKTTTHAISWETINPVEKGGFINITFATGFSLLNVTLASYDGCDVVIEMVNASARNVTLKVLEDIPASMVCTVELANIKNPSRAGTFTTLVTTLNSSFVTIDHAYSVPFEIIVSSYVSTASASVTSNIIRLTDVFFKSLPADVAASAAAIITQIAELIETFIKALP
ncbi:MAG: hypothetical protein DRJ03_29545 [Chloroflexi bacterium]|nr:MAG: hypothetical protein DRJ03_29545 [Chloroflexota bacterium]